MILSKGHSECVHLAKVFGVELGLTGHDKVFSSQEEMIAHHASPLL
jgi:hypothetical protein